MQNYKYISQIPKPFLDDLVQNNVVPFVGAGFSKNADIKNNATMPDWNEIGKLASSEIEGYTYENNAIDALSYYESSFSRAKLIEMLMRELNTGNVSPGKTHKAFCDLFTDTVCTTNFDFLLEDTFKSLKRPLSVIVSEDRLTISFNNETKLIKLHGDFNHPDGMVVTETDYDLFIRNNPIMATYVSNLFITKTMFLIGYSLDDMDFRSLWQLINSRIGKMTRPAYCISVNASQDKIARYNRRNIRVINIIDKQHHASGASRDNLKNRAETLFKQTLERCDVLDINIEPLIERIRDIKTDAVWTKIIVGNEDVPISKLIKHLDNADWVNKGRKYIRGDMICPFCQKNTITADFEEQINAFFQGEYESDIRKIQELINTFEDIIKQLLNKLDLIQNDANRLRISKLDIGQFKAQKTALEAVYSNTVKEMNNKLQEVGRKIKFDDDNSIAQELISILKDANRNILEHNRMVDDYGKEKDKLIEDVWDFVLTEQEKTISKYKIDITNIEKAKKGIQESIRSLTKQLESLDEDIINKGKNITSVQPTVDEINRSLAAYGFTNFKISPSPVQENSYQIQRLDGTLATNTLSEGEETFISFLYFLQYAKGSSDISKISARKVLVLDDPISSLDSTVLYIVSSMVKALIKGIREGTSDVEQLFILTHNVFFHKEASFVDGRTTKLNDVNYWIISKDNNVSSIMAFGMDNPIKTSYELLWQELKTNTNASLVTVQNIMRRILENYFGILGKRIDDTIVDSFGTTEEKLICRSLISWINDGSHSIPDDLYIDSYTDSINKYKEIFHQIFLKMDHEAHYKMMMQQEEEFK